MTGPPVAGRDYPSSLLEHSLWGRSEADCLDYLDWLRWPDGFVCPWCAGLGDWSDSANMHRCSDCGRRISVTAGTIFHRTRTQLPGSFQAAWLMSVSTQGMSAQNLMRTTGLGSYQTDWAMLHRFRTVMGSAGHEMLSGHVEMDETFVGGKRKPGLRGRGSAGKTWLPVPSNAAGMASAGPDCTSFRMLLRQVWRNSSRLKSRLVPRWWPMACRPTSGPPSFQACTMSRTTSLPRELRPMFHCPACTASLRFSSGSSKEPIKAVRNRSIFKVILTSSFFASTAAIPMKGACCSFGCFKLRPPASPPRTTA
jgi:hypothetical protein